MRRAQVGVGFGAVAMLVIAAAVVLTISGTRGVFGGAAVGLVVVVAAALAVDRFTQRRVHAWAYCEREDDLLVSRGVLVKRLSVVPYGRMQFIDVIAGPVERTFGLATVRMHTAAAASDARIPGLNRDDAARLRDNLARLGEARAAGI